MTEHWLGRVVDAVLSPPVEWIGRRVEQQVDEATPDLPEPPWWAVPVVPIVAMVGAVVVQLVGDRDDGADPHPAGRERERAEPEAERCPGPSASDEDTEAVTVTEALITLGLAPTPLLEQEDVRAAYRRRTLETHPDQGGDAEEFIEVREAWEVVSKRKQLSGAPSDDGGN